MMYCTEEKRANVQEMWQYSTAQKSPAQRNDFFCIDDILLRPVQTERFEAKNET